MTPTLLAVLCLCTLAHAQARPDHVSFFDPNVMTAPVPIEFPEAEMPEGARRRQVPGLCSIQLVVDEKGYPEDPRVTRCTDPVFSENSLRSVKRYRFKPARTIQDNKPVAVILHIEVSYSFGRDPDPIPFPRPNIRVGFLIPAQPSPSEPDPSGIYTLSHAFDPPNSLPRLHRFVGMGFGRAAFLLDDGVGCTADLTIDATGHPTDGHITKCDDPTLEKSALQSLLKSELAPAILNGTPVPVRASVHLVCAGFDSLAP